MRATLVAGFIECTPITPKGFSELSLSITQTSTSPESVFAKLSAWSRVYGFGISVHF